MYKQDFILIFCFIILFLLPPYICIFYSNRGTRTLKPFLFGLLTFLISKQLLGNTLMFHLMPKIDFYMKLSQNPWFYGFFAGAVSAVTEEVTRLYMIKCCKMKNSAKKCISFGIAQAWIIGITTNGLFILEVYRFRHKYPTLYPMYPCDTLVMAIIDRVIAIFMHVGFVFLLEYAITKKKDLLYTTCAIVIHLCINTGMYYIQYGFGNSAWLTEIYFLIISLFVFFMGYTLLINVRQKTTQTIHFTQKLYWKGFLAEKKEVPMAFQRKSKRKAHTKTSNVSDSFVSNAEWIEQQKQKKTPTNLE